LGVLRDPLGLRTWLGGPAGLGRSDEAAAALLQAAPVADWSDEAVAALVGALQVNSRVTGEHCLRVSGYAAAMAEALALPDTQIRHIERCGLLHDIGKMGIRTEVLEKPGALSPDEWTLMKAHPTLGVEMLQYTRSLAPFLPAVALHHERFDGKGYPFGIPGADMPLEARVISICDAYDTMTSHRPYRAALSPDEAMRRMQEGAGTQFDPRLVRIFLTRVIPRLPNGLFKTP
jgi:putative nucleotidyltransferase with HDIG domain